MKIRVFNTTYMKEYEALQKLFADVSVTVVSVHTVAATVDNTVMHYVTVVYKVYGE